MRCLYCDLDIGWFEDYSKTKWFGCECIAELKKEDYIKNMKKDIINNTNDYLKCLEDLK